MMRGNGPVLLLSALGLGLVAALAASGTEQGRRLGEKMQGQLGRFFSWAEMTTSGAASRLGLSNQPPSEAQQAMAALVSNLLDPLRTALGRPVMVTSGYRSPEVNRAVDGSHSSQHMSGEAADIKVAGLPSDTLVTAILRLGVPFDQLIWYAPERGGHVHVSFTTKRANRRQVLHAPASGGYRPWSLS